MWLVAIAAFLLVCGGPCAAQAQSPLVLVWFLTGQTYRPDRSPGTFSCGQVVADHRAAVALAKLGDSALPDIEHELDAIEAHAYNHEFGSDWLEVAYAKIIGPSVYTRLRKMETQSESESARLYLDRAIALSLGLTSFVSASRSVTSRFPYQCKNNTNTDSLILGNCPTGTHAEQLMNIHCDRYDEPRDALDQLIGALETNDEIFFELQLGPGARTALDAILKRRSWDELRAELFGQHSSRGDLAVGYRFEEAGHWSQPDRTLDEDRTASPDLENPVLETNFTSASGAACGNHRVSFVRASTSEGRTAPYLVNNSDLAGLLAVLGSCAGSE